jgi:DNA polymerase I
MAETLLLIDASNSIYRAFHALPPLANAAGVPTQATLGFVTMLRKVLRERKPDYAIVVWDHAGGKQRRRTVYADYKATRDSMPEDLGVQLPHIRRVVGAYPLCSVEFAGEEADDVIATLVRAARAQGLDVSIVSTDRDLMQLVDEHVSLLDTMKDRVYDAAAVEERFGVTPAQMLDFRALTGDSSDNIPGVRGIGDKGAASLLREHGTLDALLAVASTLPGKRQREALVQGADDARLSRELSRLSDDLPLMFDPEAARVREPDRDALLAIFRELELKRLIEELEGDAPVAVQLPLVPAPDVTTRVVRDAAALDALLERLRPARSLAIAAALEPEGAMEGELCALALSASDKEADLIALREIGEGEALERLRPLLSDPERTWVGHDLKRECVALGRRGIELAGALRDSAVAAYVLDASQQVDRPEILARSHLGRELPADDAAFGKGAKRRALDCVPVEELGAYFGAHTASAFALQAALEAKLARTGQLGLLEELDLPLIPVLARMERAGVRVDVSVLEAIGQDLARDLAAAEGRIHALAGGAFNIQSPKQLQHVLFEKLALPPSKRTKTGFSTDESVLEELALNYELPREVLEYRRLSKLKGTYVDALPPLIHPETGRIHCRISQIVAATGRLSASNPNLQNIPIRTLQGQRIREAFVPAEGRRILSADYSQIELRVLAHLSGDPALTDAFLSGQDIHVQTAARVFEIAPDVVTPEQRSQMKAVNFGIIYGSSAFGIARQLGISQAQAAAHIRAYFERYPGVKGYLDRAVGLARERGYAETLDGRRRYLPDLASRNRVLRSAAERMATNSAIQGTAADLIKRAMVRIDAELRQPGAPEAEMILQVHDELLFEVRPGAAARLRELVSRHMQGVAQLAVPLVVHLGEGGSWREAH